MNAGRLEGRRVLVTGGTKGIGAAIARRALAEGADVLVTARAEPDGVDPERFVAADLSRAEDVDGVVRAAGERLGGVDVLVNNAGGQIRTPGGALATEDAAWQHDLELNLMAAVRLDRALIPGMIERGGGVVLHVGSAASRIARPPTLPYTAAKAALTAYSKGLAIDVGPHGVRVNIILPGFVRSEGVDVIAQETGRSADDVERDVVESLQVPLGRAGAVEEVADLALFLVSDRSAYISGSQFVIDGGAMPTV